MAAPSRVTSPARVSELRDRVESELFGQVMALPAGVQRLLAGRPVVVDGQTLAVDTQLMLRLLRVAGKPGPETLPLAAGRRAFAEQTRIGGGRQSVGEVRELSVAGLSARLYVPTGAPPTGPLLVFFHGGGFFLGDLDTHESPCRFIAERAGVRVLSVAYRLAPEHPFPAAYDDAVAAFAWVHDHPDAVGADPDRIGVAGDSAGGNLAAGVAHAAARSGLACKAAILLYPAMDRQTRTRSEELFGAGFYLTDAFMQLANDSYADRPEDPADPRFSPGLDSVPPGLAPTYVFTAGFDPLRDEGEAYAQKLAGAGADVSLHRFPEQIHGFLNVLLGRSSVAAVVEVTATVRRSLLAP